MAATNDSVSIAAFLRSAYKSLVVDFAVYLASSLCMCPLVAAFVAEHMNFRFGMAFLMTMVRFCTVCTFLATLRSCVVVTQK